MRIRLTASICQLVFVLSSLSAAAQGSMQNWFFGNGGGLRFVNGNPVPVTTGQLYSYEPCAVASDATGQLGFYASGELVWDRNHTVMPNSVGLLGNFSTSQGTLIVPDPGNSALYYMFGVDACENLLAGGMWYSVIDMRLRNGLGDVTSARNVRIPTPAVTGQLTEKLTSVPHANGRDMWVLVHEWLGNGFFAFLVTPTGVSATPVVSRVGTVHRGGGGNFGNANAVGHMKASADGRLLGVAIRDTGLELFNFDNNTGVVSNARRLRTGDSSNRTYGIAFSADNTKLYTTDLFSSVYQYNLSSPSPATTEQVVGNSSYPTGALQMGPDGRIYVSLHQSPAIGAITNPSAAGFACGYQNNFVSVGGTCQVGLPNFSNYLLAPPTVAIATAAVCLGSVSSFSASVTPAAPTASYAWNFGDPASGPANTSTVAAPTHTYSTAGNYTVTVTVTVPGSPSSIAASQTVTVHPLPVVSLGSPRQLCGGQELVLQANAQPAGSTYRWQDGSTGSAFTARTGGTYTLSVTSPLGCVSTASVTVAALPPATVSLGHDTTLCLTSPLVLRPSAQPAGTTYRWQDGSSAASFAVVIPGTYSVNVTQPGGCTAQDAIVVQSARCPFVIPNIITPNGDTKNETFVLKGLNPSTWDLTVFNRWGKEIYQKNKYDNSWNGDGQPAGIYYYLLRSSTSAEQLRGWVEIAR